MPGLAKAFEVGEVPRRTALLPGTAEVSRFLLSKFSLADGAVFVPVHLLTSATRAWWRSRLWNGSRRLLGRLCRDWAFCHLIADCISTDIHHFLQASIQSDLKGG